MTMSTTISVDRNHLRYADGERELVLALEWSGVAKTADCPIDFEVFAPASDLERWTHPAGERIDPVRREQILDEIASYYSKGPVADIVGKNGALLRGASAFRFSLQISPQPSHYYEVGRHLAIPMRATNGESEWHKKYVADFTDITESTEPRAPLGRDHLRLIARRIVDEKQIGVTGVPLP